jgi:nucleotide-binding universal stress UspA family protein
MDSRRGWALSLPLPHRCARFVQSEDEFMRILAAIDGSESASRAVELAARLTRAFSGSLTIVHVVRAGDVPMEQLDNARREQSTSPKIHDTFSEDTLRVARERATLLGVTGVETASLLELHEGATSETITDAATRGGVDMIVLGKRGLGRLSGLVLGSVSQKVAATASCAVIVVP